MKLRPEEPADISAIRALTAAAFATTSYSDGTEGAILDQLRADGDLALSLVAEDGGRVIGQVSLSPAAVAGKGGWFGLGPVAVVPDRLGEGIGSALITAAIAWARHEAANGVVLTGSDAFYPRFGFRGGGPLTYLDTPVRYVHYLSFTGPDPHGEITFAPALQGA